MGLSHASAFAEEVDVSQHPNQGLVEVHTGREIDMSYRDRRATHGFLVGLTYSTYRPTSYLSLIDGREYDAMFSGPLSMGQIEAGYKLNISGLSFALVGSYGTGSISEGNSQGESRNLFIEKTALKALVVLDGFLEEPLIAPYVGFEYWKFGIDESIPTLDQKISGESQPGTALIAGVLLQLNWIEPEISRKALMSAGLENTYVNFFVIQHGTTSSSDDPDTSSEFNWGAGLMLEF